MRIIAGSARRVTLAVAPGSDTRPFLEMARGALFNSLGARVAGARVLDCFAGSGALGLEALSRGAASCLFVERDRAACRVLEKNVAACRMGGRARIVRGDAAVALAGRKAEFDVIFLDPPFPELDRWREDGPAGEIMAFSAAALTGGGVLVFRIEEGKVEPPRWPGLELESDRRYGRSRICRYGKPASGGEALAGG